MNKSALRKYINEKLEKGEAVQIVSELREISSRWVIREEQHAAESMREERIRSGLGKSDELLQVAMNPATGLFGAFLIPKPEGELDFENGGTQAADPIRIAKRGGAILAERLYRAAGTAKKAVSGLHSGKVQSYDDLMANIRSNLPENVHPDTVMAILAQAHKPSVTLDTLKGQVTLGGVEQMKKSIGCAATYSVVADIRAIDDDGKPNGRVQFKVHSVLSSTAEVPVVLKSKGRVGALLQTGSDAKTLALLYFAKLHQSMVTLELQMDYQFADRNWDVKVLGIQDEKELLAKDRPAQAVFFDW
ncbi:MAG: hypothetical protein ACREUI_07250 [Burkholderiales bacterium]